MFYNLLNYPTAPPANREEALASIIDFYAPDILMVCELETESGGAEILSRSLNTTTTRYASAPFVANSSNPYITSQQLLYYDEQKFSLIAQQQIPTSIRDINWYTLRFTKTPSLTLHVFIAHLKASQGDSNEAKRLEMVRPFLDTLTTLPKDDYVLFAGDLNLYHSDEPAYSALLTPTPHITLVDPIDMPGNWHNNSAFAEIHTQSTRLSTSEFDDFGSGGGIDDRFDFILISKNLTTSPQLQYLPDSYTTIGNNGNCFNKRINAINCEGTYNKTLRDALYTMSDHLPVVMELTSDTSLLSVPDIAQNGKTTIPLINGTVIEDQLQVDTSHLQMPIDWKVYNTLGQEMHAFTTHTTTAISITHFSAGIYYLIPTNSPYINPIKFTKRN